MAWVQIRINSTKENAEAISDELMELGCPSVTFVDAKDTPIYEPKLGEVTLWADTTVIGLFDASVDMQFITEQLALIPALQEQFVYKI